MAPSYQNPQSFRAKIFESEGKLAFSILIRSFDVLVRMFLSRFFDEILLVLFKISVKCDSFSGQSFLTDVK